MDKIIDVADRLGIGDRHAANLAAALGASEITPFELAAAYADARQRRQADRAAPGRADAGPARPDHLPRRHRATATAAARPTWDGSPPPNLPDTRAQVVDPRNAYQMVSMLEGVVRARHRQGRTAIGKPLAGKTGTTNDSKDTWFVGFSPDLVVGVFVGFDQPQPMGKGRPGATVALPIWIEFMQAALKDQPATPFRTPPGSAWCGSTPPPASSPAPATAA